MKASAFRKRSFCNIDNNLPNWIDKEYFVYKLLYQSIEECQEKKGCSEIASGAAFRLHRFTLRLRDTKRSRIDLGLAQVPEGPAEQ